MLLELCGVAKSYGATDAAGYPPERSEGRVPTPVLRDVDLQLAAGESVAIVGPSGSGKSTLLNIIGTLDRPDRGRVLLNGKDLSILTEPELAAVRCREIGFVFQLHHLLPQCTVLENVLVPTLALKGSFRLSAFSRWLRRSRLRRSHRKEGSRPQRDLISPGQEPRAESRERERSEERARRLLERVGLSQRLSHRPGQLSGGERQRVAVVRALINEPKLLLADEPTGSLDRAAADDLARLLIELNREERVSLIVVTHTPSLAAQMSRVLALRDGTLVAASDAP